MTAPTPPRSARYRGLELQLIELGRILPEDFLALLVREPFGYLVRGADVPVRVARPVQEHVLLARQGRPRRDHLLVVGRWAVELSIYEVDGVRQVGRRDPGRPWRLLEVRATERVHAPGERGGRGTAAVPPDALQVRTGAGHPRGAHEHRDAQTVDG